MTDQHDNQAGATRSEPDARSMRTVAMTALGGTSIEWYDFFIYGTAAALVSRCCFFPMTCHATLACLPRSAPSPSGF